uniref:Ig-like domain-containing protein n=1 Tax=Cyprinus carpio TaxID=7962 RepID=A0A8C1GTP6_CYPCA
IVKELFLLLIIDCVWSPALLDSLLFAELGSSVIIPCSHSDDYINSVLWYKHSIGKKPLLIFMTISELHPHSDCTYACVILMYLQNVKFLSESDGMRRTTVLQQPVSDRLNSGDSVTLQCSVISQICAGEYRVYWFRHSSGHSDPGIIYTHDNRSDQCMEKSESSSSIQSCVYSLSQTELTPSDAGIYYCAVATCGKIHLGNGTKDIFASSLLLHNPSEII